MKPVFLLIAVLFPCALLAQEPVKPIRIGAVYGFTGFANVWSEQARRGMELALEEVNGEGGINGRPLEIVYEDSRSSAADAVSAFNSTWGHTYRDVWVETAVENGVNMAAVLCTDDRTTDYRAELLRLKANNPDALIIGYGIDRAMRRIKETGGHPLILTSSDLVEAVHERGMARRDAEGVFYNDWPPGQAFRDKFEHRYKVEPIMEPRNSYEAVRAVAYALRANSGDLRSALEQVRYAGAAGPIDFTRSHAGNYAEGSLFRVQNGAFVRLR